MNLKGKIYVPISMIWVLMVAGCGDFSSRADFNEGISEESEQVAVLIQESNIKATSALDKRQRISSPLSLKTMSADIKEDGEHGTDKWIIYDKSPRGATISNVFDEEKRSNVIKFEGDGLRNGFVIGFWTSTPWKDTKHKVISWKMKITNNYVLYVRVSTKKGYRYLYYTPADYSYGVSHYDNPHYIHHGLGINSNDGTWQAFTRDLSADLKDFDPGNNIISVDGFFVRGSGMFDDIVLLQKKPSSIDKSINSWLLSKNLTMGRETVVSDDKTRAIVYAYRKGEPYSDITYIFDISNLDDINKLAESPWPHYGYPIEAKIKDGEYIILARNSEFIIYNYTSGKEISNTAIGQNIAGIDNYLVISDNYAIYHYIDYDNFNVLAKIDYADRKNPVVTTLYSTDQDHSYTLSDDKTKVLVKDKDNNVIDKINL